MAIPRPRRGSAIAGRRPARSSTWARAACDSAASRTSRSTSSARRSRSRTSTPSSPTTRAHADRRGSRASAADGARGCSALGCTHALRPHDRAPAGADLRRDRSPSPTPPRRRASRRSSAPITTPASPAERAARRPTPGPRSPAWPARRRTIRLGVLVSPVTFRIPGNLAKVIQTVDEMSGRSGRGRVRRGLERGRARAARHHIPAARRALRHARGADGVIHGVWTEPDGWAYEGQHWQVRGSKRHGEVARGGRRHPHIIFGGQGRSAAGGAGGAIRRRVQPQLGVAGRRTGGLRAGAGRVRGDRPRSGRRRLLGDDGRAGGRDRCRAARSGPRPARGPRPGRHEARRGWPSVAGGGSWARPTRRTNASRPSRRSGRPAGHAPGLPASRPRPRSAHRPLFAS